jgi:hypothetical protein
MNASAAGDLESIASIVADAPNCLKFLQCWKGWRRSAMLPSRENVRPEDLGPAIRDFSILEVFSPQKAIYRLAGTSHVEAFGPEIVGANLFDYTPPEAVDTRSRRTWAQVTRPCGSYLVMTHKLSSRRETVTRTLSLPVRPNEPDGAMLLYLAIDTVGAGAEPGEETLSEIALAREYLLIDIGHGVPDL